MNLSSYSIAHNDLSLSGCKYRTLFSVAQLLAGKIFLSEKSLSKPLIMRCDFGKIFYAIFTQSGKEIPDQPKPDDKIAIGIAGSCIKRITRK